MHQIQKQLRLPDFAVLLDAPKAALAASGLNPLGDVNSSTALPPVPAEEPLTAGIRGRVRQRRPVWRWHLQCLVDGAWRALLSDKDLHVAVARTLARLAQQQGASTSMPFAEAASAAMQALHLRVVVGGGSRLECVSSARDGTAQQPVTVETLGPSTADGGTEGTAVSSTMFRVPTSQEAEGDHKHMRAGVPAPLTLPAVTALTRSSGNDKAGGHFGAPAAKHRHSDKRHILGGLKVEERKLRRQRADAAAREKARQSELLRAAARDARAALPMGGSSMRSTTTSLAGSGGSAVPASPVAAKGGQGGPTKRTTANPMPGVNAAAGMGLPANNRPNTLRPMSRGGAANAQAPPSAGAAAASASLLSSASGPALGVGRPRLQLGNALGGTRVRNGTRGPVTHGGAVLSSTGAVAPYSAGGLPLSSGGGGSSASAPALGTAGRGRGGRRSAAPRRMGGGVRVGGAAGAAGGGEAAFQTRGAQRWGLARR